MVNFILTNKKIFSKKILIVQCSKHYTGSTFLVNLLYGFIEPTKYILYGDLLNKNELLNNTIIKTHNVNINQIIKDFSNRYYLFFICSERDELKIDNNYYNYRNVLRFNYNDLLETETNTLKNIVDNVYNKLIHFLPSSIPLSKETAINRITNMNKLYENIKNKPFTYINLFYHLHGSHRNRNG